MNIYGWTVRKTYIGFFLQRYNLIKDEHKGYFWCVDILRYNDLDIDILSTINKLDGFFIDNSSFFMKFKLKEKHLQVLCRDLKKLPKRLY